MAKIKTLDEALEVLAKKEAENAELVEVVSDLRTKLTVATKAIDAQENIVEHDGKKYKVACKSFHFNGSVHLAAELADKQEVIAELVKEGAGFLIEIQ